MLGQIRKRDLNDLSTELQYQIKEFNLMKKKLLPNIENVESDPLAVLSTDSQNSWKKYYEDIDLIKFIRGDLERLFIQGVPDEYFQTNNRQEILLNVLFVWSVKHNKTSYRQGMHELAAVILFVIENELLYWNAAMISNPLLSNHCLASIFTNENMDSHTFWIFDGLMKHMEALYTPPSPKSDTPPFVVRLCNYLQEELLSEVDPKLSRHLNSSGVQAQLYGLRWSRLLLCREVPLGDSHQAPLLRLWDFLFANCIRESCTSNSSSNSSNSCSLYIDIYNSSPLLQSLGDCMVALILNMRVQLMTGGLSEVMSLLMRPQTSSDVDALLSSAALVRTTRISVHESPERLSSGQGSLKVKEAAESGTAAASVSVSASARISLSPPLVTATSSTSAATSSVLPPFPSMPSRSQQQPTRAAETQPRTSSCSAKLVASPQQSLKPAVVHATRSTFPSNPLMPYFSSSTSDKTTGASKSATKELRSASCPPLSESVQDSELQTFSSSSSMKKSSSECVLSVEARLRELAEGLRSRSRPIDEKDIDKTVLELLHLADVLAGGSTTI